MVITIYQQVMKWNFFPEKNLRYFIGQATAREWRKILFPLLSSQAGKIVYFFFALYWPLVYKLIEWKEKPGKKTDFPTTIKITFSVLPSKTGLVSGFEGFTSDFFLLQYFHQNSISLEIDLFETVWILERHGERKNCEIQ